MKKQHRRPSGFHALSVADYHCKKAMAQDRFDREIERNMRERQRLMWQTGDTAAERREFLVAAYRAATEALPATWAPPITLDGSTSGRPKGPTF